MMFYDTIVKIKRLKTSVGNARSLIATATGEASIQPLSGQAQQVDDGRFAALYAAFVEVDLPVQAGDTLSAEDGRTFIVRDVILRDEIPFPHQKLILSLS